ncbi:MAG TPA: hypothetical protein VF166_05740 [Gemmatimonadaceae bacterium]
MKHKPSGSLVISIALHVMFGAVLLYVLSLPFPLREWLELTPGPKVVENVHYVALPPRGTNTPGRSGGNGKPVTNTPAAPPPHVVAPSSVPMRLPPPPPVPKQKGGSGPIIGAGGATQGVVPSFSDPRVWLPPGAMEAQTPKGLKESLDSVLATIIQAHNDSLAIVAGNNSRKPGDWTVDHNGKKYGIDQKHIYLGSFKIPTAILALLPLNVQGNPSQIQRTRAFQYMHDDIQYQAQQAMNEEEFRDAVKKIRERKQREHDEELAKKKAQQAAQRADDPSIP